MAFNCPACAAEITFKNKASVFTVCPYCSQVLVKQNLNFESMGRVAELPEDMTLIQIGTTGKIQGRNFQVIGRQKITWEQGSWNEWNLLFEDQKNLWLAEAQGSYSLSNIEDSKDIQPDWMKRIGVGNQIRIGKKEYEIVDIKEAFLQGVQGELPLRIEIGRKSISVDLVCGENEFANIDFTKNNYSDVKIYVGHFFEFESFYFQNLRRLNGW